jgi:hypothetical protein
MFNDLYNIRLKAKRQGSTVDVYLLSSNEYRSLLKMANMTRILPLIT